MENMFQTSLPHPPFSAPRIKPVPREIRPCISNIAYRRFEVYKTFLCVFMSNFMVFMR